MLKLSMEELQALNLLLHFTTVKDLLSAAMHGYTVKEEPTNTDKELSDLCWKVLKVL